MANKRFIMLSCDGGGVRGLITAKLLQTLDPAFLQSVSLFAGTSTGSIIALPNRLDMVDHKDEIPPGCSGP